MTEEEATLGALAVPKTSRQREKTLQDPEPFADLCVSFAASAHTVSATAKTGPRRIRLPPLSLKNSKRARSAKRQKALKGRSAEWVISEVSLFPGVIADFSVPPYSARPR